MSPLWLAAGLGVVLVIASRTLRRALAIRPAPARVDATRLLFAPEVGARTRRDVPVVPIEQGSLQVRPCERAVSTVEVEEPDSGRVERPSRWSLRRWATPTEGKILFWVPFALYISAAAVLML